MLRRPMTQLYKLADELVKLHDEIADNDGILTDELEKRLDASTLDFQAKAENIGKWVLSLSGDTSAIESEIARLARRKEIIENLQKRLKNYLKLQMERIEKTKLELPTFTVSVCKSPARLMILDEKKLPPEYFIVVPEHVELDKTGRERLKENLKNGVVVDGAILETGTHLRIK